MTFQKQNSKKWIQDDVNSIIYEMATKMFRTGIQVIDLARAKTKDDGGFVNITWNLRRSIGCLLVINYHIPYEFIYFPPISKESNGRQKGIEFAREIAQLVDDGEPARIMVAGMDYASYVQTVERDVLEDSTLLFVSLLKQVLKL